MRTSPRTLLVPLDGSELADRVLGHVEALLAAAPWNVVLLRVLEPVLPAARAEQREAAEAHLAAARARLQRGADGRITLQLRAGDPAAEVLFAIGELRPALVAMSTHGRGGVLQLVRGSVAERVLRACTTPLLLVPSRIEPPGPIHLRRILVPVDGTDRALAVLPLVEELARLQRSEVALLHVEPIGAPPDRAASLGPSRLAADPLRSARERLAAAGITVRALVDTGVVAPRILQVAEREDVDLIAMATRGGTGADRLVDGSVCEELLRLARRPVLAVHVA